MYLGAVSSNLLGLTSTSKAEWWFWSFSVETSEDEANEGGLIMSVAATSLPSLLDLESTLRLFNLRLWNKLMVILSFPCNSERHLRSCFEEVIQLRPLLSSHYTVCSATPDFRLPVAVDGSLRQHCFFALLLLPAVGVAGSELAS